MVLGALVSFSYLLLDIFFKKDIYEKEQTKHRKRKEGREGRKNRGRERKTEGRKGKRYKGGIWGRIRMSLFYEGSKQLKFILEYTLNIWISNVQQPATNLITLLHEY